MSNKVTLEVLDLSRPVETVSSNVCIEDVVSKFKSLRVGCLIISDGENAVSGIFTERDYLLKIAGKESEALRHEVGEYMTRDPVTVTPKTTLSEALVLMDKNSFRHLIVTEESGELKCVISIKDIVNFFAKSLK